MEPTEQEIKELKEQLEQFEVDVRKNAELIGDFCASKGMTTCQAGAAAEWFVMCVRKAISDRERNPITND